MLAAVPPQLPQQEVVVQTALIYNGGRLIEILWAAIKHMVEQLKELWV